MFVSNILFPSRFVQVCAALNDLEYVWRTVASMPDDLHLETVVSAVEATGEATADQCRADVTSLLDPVFNQYGTYSMLIVGRIAVRVSVWRVAQWRDEHI